MRSSAGCWIGAHSAGQFGLEMVVGGLDLVVVVVLHGLFDLSWSWWFEQGILLVFSARNGLWSGLLQCVGSSRGFGRGWKLRSISSNQYVDCNFIFSACDLSSLLTSPLYLALLPLIPRNDLQRPLSSYYYLIQVKS